MLSRSALAACDCRILLLFLLASSAAGASDPAYDALRAARPDGRVIRLEQFTFETDVLQFRLDGDLHLLADVEGKTPGAVFLGRGSYRLTPVTIGELRQLRIVTNDDDLTFVEDTFKAAVFLGSALPVAAAQHAAVEGGDADPRALARWDAYMKKQRKSLQTNVHIRLLREIVDEDGPFFFGWIDGERYPPTVLIVDPTGAESVGLAGHAMGGEQTMMYVDHDQKGGIWYSCRSRSEIATGRLQTIEALADAKHFSIDATIEGADLSLTTTITFTPSENLRVLPLQLASALRLSAVEVAPVGNSPSWSTAAFIQEDKEEDADAAVVFPSRLEAGKDYLLRATCAGDEVLEKAGDGNFTVTRRTSWYPNVGGYGDLATYRMRFRTPAKFHVVAIGAETENRVEGRERIALWETERPVRIAGFNYGTFKQVVQTDEDTGTTVEVYTNEGTPDIIQQMDAALGGGFSGKVIGLTHVPLDTAGLTKSAMADGINTLRTGNVFFGPLREKRVAITQQSQWFFGQSWPTLIYLPYIAALDGYTRMSLGLYRAGDFVDQVGPHEMAHQWWGHQIGFRTYHDVWISEGFAEFTASLVVEQTNGSAAYDTFYEKAQKEILERPRFAMIDNTEAGPISQGWRVATWRNPSAYGPIVYTKGAFVLHMLRMAMWDNERGDADFIAMMREFAAAFSGRDASTDDFQRVVEKHATPDLRVTTDGSLNWFFDQWVYGTAIPRLASKFEFAEATDGKYKVTGTVTQSEVPDNFVSVVGLYVHFGRDRFAKLGTMPIAGNTTRPIDFEVSLPDKPKSFSINSRHDVLSR